MLGFTLILSFQKGYYFSNHAMVAPSCELFFLIKVKKSIKEEELKLCTQDTPKEFFFFFLLGNCLCRYGGSNPRANGFMVNRVPLGQQGPVKILLKNYNS